MAVFLQLPIFSGAAAPIRFANLQILIDRTTPQRVGTVNFSLSGGMRDRAAARPLSGNDGCASDVALPREDHREKLRRTNRCGTRATGIAPNGRAARDTALDIKAVQARPTLP
jgi:hypothetical protein